MYHVSRIKIFINKQFPKNSPLFNLLSLVFFSLIINQTSDVTSKLLKMRKFIIGHISPLHTTENKVNIII